MATTTSLSAEVSIPTVNVSASTSVVVSDVGVTEKEPVLLLIVTVPLLVAKSPALVNITQYNVVGDGRLVVVTVKVNGDPSSTESAADATAYVGGCSDGYVKDVGVCILRLLIPYVFPCTILTSSNSKSAPDPVRPTVPASHIDNWVLIP